MGQSVPARCCASVRTPTGSPVTCSGRAASLPSHTRTHSHGVSLTNFPAGTSAEWLGVGRGGRAAPPFVLGGVGACLSLARAVLPGRIAAERLIHYHIELAHTAPPPDGVRLAPVTDALVRRIHAHPDHTETELAAGLRWWEQGWRRAFVWLEDERPLCIQWL